ncbi:hypothetical protein [uncultured Ruminobacter sp.]|uniref:hypothetical protein n=1 Tax=uncultured Ruminobacter sp. TaxID=538947 RepID=UPI0025D07A74|nr:hypothetical protein [uncultured Ruminobacter sp.]
MTIEPTITKLKNAAELISEAMNELSAFIENAETKQVSTENAAPAPATVAEPETPKLSFEDVRGILADIARAGNREGVKALLEKYGASKLSALDPKCYADVLKDAEGLKNA